MFQFCGDIFLWEKKILNIFEYRFKRVTRDSSLRDGDDSLALRQSDELTALSSLAGILFMLSGDADSEQSHDSRTCL